LICNTCKEDKPLDQFRKNGPWYVKKCKNCIRITNKRYNDKKRKAESMNNLW